MTISDKDNILKEYLNQQHPKVVLSPGLIEPDDFFWLLDALQVYPEKIHRFLMAAWRMDYSLKAMYLLYYAGMKILSPKVLLKAATEMYNQSLDSDGKTAAGQLNSLYGLRYEDSIT